MSVLVVLIVVALVWLLGDFIHAAVINYRLRRWISTLSWGDDGVREDCRAYSSGQGEFALLLVHGFNNSPRIWDRMVPQLVASGFHCRVMRLPGFAERPNETRKATAEHWLAAIESELQELQAEHPRVAIVGHSLGAVAAIRHLSENPGAAESAVLIAPALAVSNRRSPLLPTRVWHEFGRWTLLFTRFVESPFTMDVHDPERRDYTYGSSFAHRGAIDELYRLTDRVREGDVPFRTPMMMILSRDDQIVSWQAAEHFLRQGSSPENLLVFAPDTGHELPIDNGAEELALQMAGWLQEQPGTA